MKPTAPLAIVLLAVALLLSPVRGDDGATPAERLLADLDTARAGAAADAAHVLQAVAHAEGLQVPPTPDCPALDDALRAHADRLRVPTPVLPALPPEVREAVACLLGALRAADAAHEATFEGADVRSILEASHAVEGPGSDRLAEALAGRDHQRTLVAAVHLAQQADRASLVLSDLPCGSVSPVDVPPLLRIDSLGDSLHIDNYALTLELCGDDTYDNHAGGILVAVGAGIFDTSPKPGGVRVTPGGSVGVTVGDDVQDADAVVTSSLVLDLDGDDTYGVRHAPMLKDAANGCTTDPVVPRVGTLGGAVMGVGMLVDAGGNNTYVGRTQTQGAGHILGVGVLASGAGNDTYEAVRSAQGQGLLGGVGVLVDQGGDDAYRAVVPTGGVWNGDLALCDDLSRYMQGSAFDRRAGPLAPSVGILLDRSGDDVYAAQTLAQGFGQGPGAGILFDGAGNDRYTADQAAQGAAQGRSRDVNPQAPWGSGLGLLVERQGNDVYAATARAQGWSLGNSPALPPTDPVGALQWALDRNEALGALLDDGGADSYDRPGRADQTVHLDGTIGLLVDR